MRFMPTPAGCPSAHRRAPGLRQLRWRAESWFALNQTEIRG